MNFLPDSYYIFLIELNNTTPRGISLSTEDTVTSNYKAVILLIGLVHDLFAQVFSSFKAIAMKTAKNLAARMKLAHFMFCSPEKSFEISMFSQPGFVMKN